MARKRTILDPRSVSMSLSDVDCSFLDVLRYREKLRSTTAVVRWLIEKERAAMRASGALKPSVRIDMTAP